MEGVFEYERVQSIQYNKDNAWFCVYLNTIAKKQGFLFIYNEHSWPKALKFKKIIKTSPCQNPMYSFFSLSFFWELTKQTNVKSVKMSLIWSDSNSVH